MNNDQRRTVTVEEAARIIGISRTTAYQCVRTGAIPSVHFGRRIVVPIHLLAASLSELEEKQSANIDRTSKRI